VSLVRQAVILAGKYDCAVTNPPYMGKNGMNPALKEFAKKYYPESKSDLFAMFMVKKAMITKQDGLISMITMQSWMFLSSYEKLREWMIAMKTLSSMLHLGARAFSTITGEVVQTTTFCFFNRHFGEYRPNSGESGCLLGE
jgi:type II restriction/modification system DNA methylase subunit YeeA